MLIASATHEVKCHNIANGEMVHKYIPPGHTGNEDAIVKHFTWNKDGTWLSITPVKGSAYILRIKDTQIYPLHNISNIREPTCTAFQHSTKKFLAVGTANGSVLTYDFKRKVVAKSYPKIDSNIFALHYCANDTHIICGCNNGEVIVFNAQSEVKSCNFKIPNSNTLSCVRGHQKKRHLIVGGSENGIVAVWDLNSNRLRYCCKFHTAPVRDVAFIPNREDILFSIGMDKKMRFQDVYNGINLSEIETNEIMTCMDISYDAINLVVGSESGHVYLYDVRNVKTPKMTIKCHDGWIDSVALQPMSAVNQTDPSIEDQTDTIEGINPFLVQEVLPVIVEESVKNAEQKQPNFADSFLDDFGLQASLNSPITHISKQSLNADSRRGSLQFRRSETDADSFMEALVFQSSQSLRSSVGTITKEVKSLLEAKPELLSVDKTDQISRKSLNAELLPAKAVEEICLTKKIRESLASTPKLTYNDGLPFSPIVNSSHAEPLLNMDNLRKVVQEVVRSELKEHSLSVMAFNRRHFLDMQMANVREFIKIEESFNDMAEIINKPELPDDQSIYQEFYILKEENMRLKEELRRLKDM